MTDDDDYSGTKSSSLLTLNISIAIDTKVADGWRECDQGLALFPFYEWDQQVRPLQRELARVESPAVGRKEHINPNRVGQS